MRTDEMEFASLGSAVVHWDDTNGRFTRDGIFAARKSVNDIGLEETLRKFNEYYVGFPGAPARPLALGEFEKLLDGASVTEIETGCAPFASAETSQVVVGECTEKRSTGTETIAIQALPRLQERWWVKLPLAAVTILAVLAVGIVIGIGGQVLLSLSLERVDDGVEAPTTSTSGNLFPIGRIDGEWRSVGETYPASNRELAVREVVPLIVGGKRECGFLAASFGGARPPIGETVEVSPITTKMLRIDGAGGYDRVNNPLCPRFRAILGVP